MGNPCTEWSGCRPFVIAKLKQLKKLVSADAPGVFPGAASSRRQLDKSHEKVEGSPDLGPCSLSILQRDLFVCFVLLTCLDWSTHNDLETN